jgi:hypothetical protein
MGRSFGGSSCAAPGKAANSHFRFRRSPRSSRCYDDLEPVTRSFLNDPERYLRRIID